MTVFRDIGLALTSLVAAAPSLSGGWCKYETAAPTPREHGRAIRVTKVPRAVCTVSDVAGGPRDWTTVYAIEIQAREKTVDQADAAADLLLGEVFEILAAEGVGAAMNLGVMALLIGSGAPGADAGLSVDFSDAEEGTDTVCSTTLQFIVNHRTRGDQLVPFN
jgi:hypothetical protein